jgi:hypothetical protein
VCIPDLPEAEPRLQDRYHRLVVSHLSPSQRLAAGLHSQPDLTQPFAATQAAWRFYANPAVSLAQLAGPLVDCAREAFASDSAQWALTVLDWSPLHYGHHRSKADRVELANRRDLGYELFSALAISDRDGSPIAPVAIELKAAAGLYCTRTARPVAAPSRLDRLSSLMDHVRSLQLGKPTVFIIDREADSVGHLRNWQRCGHFFVVRADDRQVLFEGREQRLLEVVAKLRRRRCFKQAGEVLFKGKPARHCIAETQITLHRPARTHRVDPQSGKARHHNIAGEQLQLRLIVSEIRTKGGKLLARWLLLSNLPQEVKAQTIALWYYWRWRIESYHKLLKGAGQELENWQQETAAALCKRLLVAAMSAVVVWKLARDKRKEAGQLRQLLIQLSGRQMKRRKGARSFTEPALLAGMGILVAMLYVLEHHDPNEIRALAESVLPGLFRTPRQALRESG